MINYNVFNCVQSLLKQCRFRYLYERITTIDRINIFLMFGLNTRECDTIKLSSQAFSVRVLMDSIVLAYVKFYIFLPRNTNP